MEDKKQNTGLVHPDSGDSQSVSGLPVAPEPVDFGAGALSDSSVATVDAAVPRTHAFRRVIKPTLQWAAVAAVVLAVLVGLFLMIRSTRQDDARLTSLNPAASFDSLAIPLDSLNVNVSDQAFPARQVLVNGQLRLGQGLVLTPSLQPSTPQPGQLYYDQGTNLLGYFNGTEFVFFEDNAGVLSIQGQTGNVDFAGGNGIAINGTTINNTGVVGITSLNPTLIVDDDGNGNVTLNLVGGGSGTIASPGGTDGRIAKFIGVQTIADSLLSESGTTVTVNGNLSVTGGLTLSAPLAVSSGGIGVGLLSANGVLLGNGTSPVSSLVAGGAGLCLVSTAGAPQWDSCTCGGSVTSLNLLDGALTLQGTTNQITVSDNSTDTITLALPQNIHTAANPQFASMTLTGDLAVNGGDITSTGALNITPGGALTIGVTGQALTLQGNASTTLVATDSGNATSLVFEAPIADVTYRLLTAAAGTYDICTSVGNCTVAGVAGGDLTGSYPDPTITSIQGSVITINTPLAGHVLVYNDSNSQWENVAISSDITIDETGVATIANDAVTSAKIDDGTIVNDDLASGTFSNIGGVGTLTAGSLGAGFSTVNVAQGGTGATSFTANGVLYGNTTGALQVTAAGTTGQCLVGNTGAAPSWTSCSGLVTLQNAYANGNSISTTGNDIAFTLNGSQSFTVTTDAGNTTGGITFASGNTTAFRVKDGSGDNLLVIDGSNTRMGLFMGGENMPSLDNTLQIQGGIELAGTGNSHAWLTPESAPINTILGIESRPVSDFDSLLALGLTVASGADARGLVVADARSVAHQPSIAVLSPDENQISGLSWDGSNSISYFKTSTDFIGLSTPVSGGRILLDTSTSGLAQLFVGEGGQTTGALTLTNESNSNSVSIISGTTSGSYSIQLPAAIGTAGQCLSIASVASGTETLSHASCFLQNGNSFGTTATLGTNDNNDLVLERNNAARLTIGNTDLTVASGIDLFLQGAGAYISNPQGQSGSESFGLNAVVNGANSLALGSGATTHASGGSVAVGASSSAGVSGTAVGYGSATDANAVAIGRDAGATSGSVAIGQGSGAWNDDSIAIGRGATTSGNNQLVIGSSASSTSFISRVVIGDGVTSSSPNGFTLQGTSGSGSNVAGASVTIAGGQGTGTGNGGDINFQIADPGSTGASLNSLATVLSLSGTNGSALFQNTTDGTTAFRVLNTSSVPLFTIDTTNSYVYVGNPSADATGALLVLDTKNTAGDPTGVQGAIYYNSNRGAMRCYQSGYWEDCAPLANGNFRINDEFVRSDHGFVLLDSGTAGVGSTDIDAVQGHPGILGIVTGTDSNGYTAAVLDSAGDDIMFGGGEWRYESVMRVPTISNGTNRYELRMGFLDSGNTDGCFFFYRDDVNGGEFQGACRNNSAETTCDTNVAVSAGAWYRIGVVVNAAGTSADFIINGTSRCQVASNIPTARSTTASMSIEKTAGTASRQLDIDYIDIRGQLTTPR